MDVVFAQRPAREPLCNYKVLKIRASSLGLPTIFDKDILIFVISQLMAHKDKGQETGDTFLFSMHEMCIAINHPTG
jgi:hypothetical protein